MPAKAGIQSFGLLGSRLRGSDEKEIFKGVYTLSGSAPSTPPKGISPERHPLS